MRILVLTNRRSGTPSRRKRLDVLLGRLRAEGMSVDVEAPDSADALRERASRARRSEHGVLIASGGDGTLHQVVNGLVRSPKDARPKLAVCPLGRGNDFAAEIGVGDESDTFDAVVSGRARLLDLGRAEGGVFLSIAGTGFDARAARRAQETPLLSGSALYTYAVLRTLLDFRPLQARVRHDGGTYEGLITFAATGNARRYGGGMRIAPEADLEDGLLDLCLVRDISRLTLLRMFPTVFSGRHLAHPSVVYRKTRFVEIETREPAEVFADGELLQETPLRIDVLPKELEVLARMPAL
jgi:YegS/Rv2252/BmrU family lipid kinase